MNWKKIKLGTIATVLSTIVGVLYYTFQAKDERLAGQPAAAGYMLVADTAVPVSLTLDEANWLGVVTYLNGKKLDADGYGMATFTLEDWKKTPHLLGDHAEVVVEADFPVVAFFNSSAFDVTGSLIVVRRAADGALVSEIKDRPPAAVRKILPRRDGGYTVITGREGTKTSVQMDSWYRTYMGTEPPAPPPVPATVPTPTATGTVPTLDEIRAMFRKKP